MAKISRPTIYAIVALVVAASYLYLTDDTKSKSATSSMTSKKLVKKTSDSDFTADDYKASFASITTPPRNLFTPLVARSSGTRGIAGTGVPGPMIVPPELTMGQAAWVYTGMAEVDNVATALVENSDTQEGVFLKQGEKWKLATVYRITADALVLAGPDGARHTIKVSGSEMEGVTSTPAGGGLQPLRVSPNSLQGPIGNPGMGNIQIQPSPTPTRRDRSQRLTDVQNFN